MIRSVAGRRKISSRPPCAAGSGDSETGQIRRSQAAFLRCRLFRDGGAVKISRSLKELSLKVTRAKEHMALKLGREPTVSELAGELDTDPELIAEAICAARPVISLTADSDDGISQYDLPVSGPEEELSDRLLISSIFDMLDERDRKIMDCRYFRGLTQNRTAELLGMTQVQVSRAERRILKRLKEILEE